MAEYTFDATITVSADSPAEAVQHVLEHSMKGDVAVAIFDEGTLNTQPLLLKLDAAEAKIAELKGELDNVFRHLQIVSDQSDERRRSAEDAESRLSEVLSAIRHCAGELEFDNFNAHGDPGGYCSECGHGPQHGHDALCWRKYAFAVETADADDVPPDALEKIREHNARVVETLGKWREEPVRCLICDRPVSQHVDGLPCKASV